MHRAAGDPRDPLDLLLPMFQELRRASADPLPDLAGARACWCRLTRGLRGNNHVDIPPRTILELGHPLLWQRSRPVVDARAVHPIIADLAGTLAAFREGHGFGRGIAAPQIGALERVIFIAVPGGFTSPLINPVIDEASGDTFELWDDCFSLPGLMVRVARAVRVRVSYVDEHGGARVIDAEGALAELLQHEIDHLDGILAVQRASSPEALCTRDEWARRHREAP